jgi:hypothetical protein
MSSRDRHKKKAKELRLIAGLFLSNDERTSAARMAKSAMAKSAANITFEPKPLNNGPQWLVVVTFPHAQQEQVEGFPTEFDARNWITNDSEAWLTKRGYQGI